MDEKLIDNKIFQAWKGSDKDEKKDFVAVLLEDPDLWILFWDHSSGEARKKFVNMLIGSRCTIIEQMLIEHKGKKEG